MHYRLINTQQGLAIGDYATLQEVWDIVKTTKGRMICWKQWEITGGWIWEQQPLRYYSRKERLLFKLKPYITKVENLWKTIRKKLSR